MRSGQIKLDYPLDVGISFDQFYKHMLFFSFDEVLNPFEVIDRFEDGQTITLQGNEYSSYSQSFLRDYMIKIRNIKRDLSELIRWMSYEGVELFEDKTEEEICSDYDKIINHPLSYKYLLHYASTVIHDNLFLSTNFRTLLHVMFFIAKNAPDYEFCIDARGDCDYPDGVDKSFDTFEELFRYAGNNIYFAENMDNYRLFKFKVKPLFDKNNQYKESIILRHMALSYDVQAKRFYGVPKVKERIISLERFKYRQKYLRRKDFNKSSIIEVKNEDIDSNNANNNNANKKKKSKINVYIESTDGYFEMFLHAKRAIKAFRKYKDDSLSSIEIPFGNRKAFNVFKFKDILDKHADVIDRGIIEDGASAIYDKKHRILLTNKLDGHNKPLASFLVDSSNLPF